MKKFIVKTLIFSSFTIIFYTVGLFLLAKFAPAAGKRNINYIIGSAGHLFSRLSEVKNNRNVDILFLGSSHAYRGFDNRIFLSSGFKTFNLGSSSQTPLQTKVLLSRYFNALNPKTVIYEVYPETFSLDGVESALDLISNDRNDLSSFLMVMKINNIKVYNTFIYAFVCDLLKLNNSFAESISKGKDKYIKGGYVQRETAFFKGAEFEKKEIKINKDQLKAFSEIVNQLKQSDTKLILVYAPIPKQNYRSYTNNAFFDSTMASFSEYYNFNEIINLNDSLHFYDSHHLNQNGVEIFNGKLIEILNYR